MNVFKLYLERILSQSLSETGDNPLHLYNTIPRSEIGTILTKSGPPGPFVPMIYQLPPILNVPVTHKVCLNTFKPSTVVFMKQLFLWICH